MLRTLASGEALFALAIAILGLSAIVVGAGYPMGAINDPGPGIFPVALGAVLMLIGFGILVSGPEDAGTGARLRLRPFLSVVAAILAWALLVDPLGFIPATVILGVVSSLSEPRLRPIQTAMLTIVLSVGGYLVFVYGFRMPFDAFGG